jgi:hypothetical protein
MSRVKVPLMTYPGRERAPEYPELIILTQDFAYRFAVPASRNGIRQFLSQSPNWHQQADAGQPFSRYQRAQLGKSHPSHREASVQLACIHLRLMPIRRADGSAQA